jgi:hypothetical protein
MFSLGTKILWEATKAIQKIMNGIMYFNMIIFTLLFTSEHAINT